MNIARWIDYLGGVRLEYPWLLLLLLPLAALLWRAARRPSPTLRVSWLKPFVQASGPVSGFRPSHLPSALFALALTLLVLAVARPRKGVEELKQRAEGIDIVLALDVSGSMKSIDIPESVRNDSELKALMERGKLLPRVDVAKAEIRKFVEKRDNDRIGLVVFAPQPFVACPPTLDHASLLAHLDSVDAGIIGDATGIAGPISSAVQRLKDADSKRRVLVLFTDGSNNVDARISPIQAAKLAKNYNIIAYTVGIGSPNAIIRGRDLWGNDVWQPYRNEFDRGLLEQIAKETGGKYFAAADGDKLKTVMEEIDKLEKTSTEQPRFIDYSELGPKLASAGLLLLMLGFALRHSVFLKIP